LNALQRMNAGAYQPLLWQVSHRPLPKPQWVGDSILKLEFRAATTHLNVLK